MPDSVLGAFIYINSFYPCNTLMWLIALIVPTLRKQKYREVKYLVQGCSTKGLDLNDTGFLAGESDIQCPRHQAILFT